MKDIKKAAEDTTMLVSLAIRYSLERLHDKITDEEMKELNIDIRNNVFSTLSILMKPVGERDEFQQKLLNILFCSIPKDWENPKYIYEDRLEEELRFYPPERRIWVTADCILYPVESMATKHIVNAMKCLKGDGKKEVYWLSDADKNKWYNIFKEELKFRADK